MFVHASLKRIGPVDGGARTVVAAIIQTVGSRGLVAMPGFSTDAYMPTCIEREAYSESALAEIRNAVPGYNPALSHCREMGLIADTFRTWPGTRRSAHPCVSVTARGPDCEGYLTNHSLAWACGPESPLGRFRDRPSMKIMLLGVDWTRCSALHTAETLTPRRRTKRRIFKHAGKWIETPDVADDNGRLFPVVGANYERSGALSIGLVGYAQTRLFPYAEFVNFSAKQFQHLLPSA